MLYLVDEMFKQQGKNITVKIGKPYPFNFFNDAKQPQGWANWMKRRIYEMAED